MAELWAGLSSSAGMLLFFLVHLAGVLLIPFGLPGLWLIVVACAALTLLTGAALLGWWWVLLFAAMAGVAELIEFLSGQWGARKFGGSSRAGWGAIIGGVAGIFLGFLIPIPFVGSLLMSFIGTFAGAVLGEFSEQKRRKAAGETSVEGLQFNVGFGAVLGRALGVALKMGIAFAIIILCIAVLIFG